jgi:cyclopropane fatty-acyl-phospholipid synthase-like methyltransferase
MRRLFFVPLMALLTFAPSIALLGDQAPQTQTPPQTQAPLRRPDVIFVPTRTPVAEAMMDMANVTKNDVVYDLGCGDGALVIAAAKRGARAVGVDIDPQRIQEATANVKAAGLTDRVTLILGDIFDPNIKISDATVVTLYLLPSLNEKLIPRLKGELNPGTRIVSHAFSMESWTPERSQQVDGTTIYFWTVPPRQ